MVNQNCDQTLPTRTRGNKNLASQDPPSFCLQCLLGNPQVLEQEPELGNGGGKLGVVGRDGGLEVLGYNHHHHRRQVAGVG